MRCNEHEGNGQCRQRAQWCYEHEGKTLGVCTAHQTTVLNRMEALGRVGALALNPVHFVDLDPTPAEPDWRAENRRSRLELEDCKNELTLRDAKIATLEQALQVRAEQVNELNAQIADLKHLLGRQREALKA